jgi:hypothetical protein
MRTWMRDDTGAHGWFGQPGVPLCRVGTGWRNSAIRYRQSRNLALRAHDAVYTALKWVIVIAAAVGLIAVIAGVQG